MQTTPNAKVVSPEEKSRGGPAPTSLPTPAAVSGSTTRRRRTSAPLSGRKGKWLAAAGGLLLLGGQAMAAETVYFLVGDRIPLIQVPGMASPNPESYVLPLSDPEAIAHARWLIATDPFNTRYLPYPPPPGDPPTTRYSGATPVVRLVKADDWSNRDFYRPGFPAWSWRVVELLGFADFVPADASILTLPSFVEEFFANAPDGAVWEIYAHGGTVVRELGPGMLYLSAVRQGEQIQFSWSGIWADAEYTIEAAEALDRPDWVPVVTGLKPARTNLVNLPLPAGPVQFFRLRVQPPSH